MSEFELMTNEEKIAVMAEQIAHLYSQVESQHLINLSLLDILRSFQEASNLQSDATISMLKALNILGAEKFGYDPSIIINKLNKIKEENEGENSQIHGMVLTA